MFRRMRGSTGTLSASASLPWERCIPKGLKARTKTVVHYGDNLWETRWHDGNKLSLADFIFAFILGFDRANPKSPIFDESAVPALKTFLSHFRGARILEKNPLVVEIYSDQIFPDAESVAASASDGLLYQRSLA